MPWSGRFDHLASARETITSIEMFATTATENGTGMRCVMCGMPASRIASTTVSLCNSAYCRSRHAALPLAQRCGGCSRPLDVSQWAAGHCGQSGCREEVLVRRPLEAMRKAHVKLME